MKCQYGRVSFDRPQRLVGELQLRFAFREGGQRAFEGKLINGWNVSGVTIAQSGDPLTFFSQNAGTAFGTSTTSYLTGLATPDFCPGFNNGNVKNPGGDEGEFGRLLQSGGILHAGARCLSAIRRQSPQRATATLGHADRRCRDRVSSTGISPS